jgi:hypothetical protein
LTSRVASSARPLVVSSPRAVAASYLSLGFAAAAVSLPALVSRHTHPLPAFYQEWLAFALGLAALVPLLMHPAARQRSR